MLNKRSKFVIVFAILSILLLFIIGFIQTMVLQSRQKHLATLQSTNTELAQEKNEVKKEADYIGSDEYKDEYKKHNTIIDETSTGENVDNETIAVVVK